MTKAQARPEVQMLEAFMPPEGYALDCLVATTYSVDPNVMLAIIMAASGIWDPSADLASFNTLTKEEWIRVLIGHGPKCLLIADHHGPFEGGAALDSPMKKIALDSIIKSVGRDSHPRGGSLHAKLILAFFRHPSRQVVGRLYVGSKNLTMSTFREFGAVYELQPRRLGSDESMVGSLRGFMQYLSKTEARGCADVKLRPLTRVRQILGQSDFVLGEPGGEGKRRRRGSYFLWQGRSPYGERSTPSLASAMVPVMGKGWTHAYVHSPWTRSEAVKVLATALGNETPLCIRCLREANLPKFKHDMVRYDFENGTDKLQGHQSHAKLYLLVRKEHALLMFGSANLTLDGLGIRGGPKNRQNAETLIATVVDPHAYRDLALHGQVAPDTENVSTEHDPIDPVRRLLNSIQIDVIWARARRQLEYQLRITSEAPTDFSEKVSITHELIQESVANSNGPLPIADAWPLPATYSVAWEKKDLWRVSSFVRIACHAMGVETHLIVELGREFYDGRRNSACLQYTHQEIVASLIKLFEIPTLETPGPPGGDARSADYEPQLRCLLEGLKLERYGYKLARLRAKNPELFKATVTRVGEVLRAGGKDAKLKADARFIALQRLVERLHDTLNPA